MDEVDDFLAHYGVKGMKWGVRNNDRRPGLPSRLPSKQTVKNVGSEIAWGSIGPAAVLAGLGPPVSIAIGLSATVLSKPAVRSAIADTSKASAKLMKEIGDTKMTVMREARQAKAATKAAAKAADRRLSQAIHGADKTIDAAGELHNLYTSPAGVALRLL